MNLKELFAKIPRVVWFQWRTFEYNLSRRINLDWFDIARYQMLRGKRPNLRNPKTWDEKLLWLNRYWQPDIKAELTDKVKVREYVRKLGMESLLVPVLGVWSDPDEIDFEKLPQQFALKCNHGSACNIICSNKSTLDIDDAKEQLRKWLKIDYGKLFNEKHYSKIKPMILGEEYLPAFEGQSSVVDYKIHCFNGQPEFFLVCSNRNTLKHELTLTSFTKDWKHVNFLENEIESAEVELIRPANLSKMMDYASILSQSFPYVRVDFYEIDNKIYFGELTFTPAANIMTYYSKTTQLLMGEKLILPTRK